MDEQEVQADVLLLSRDEISSLGVDIGSLMEAVEKGLLAHGQGNVVMPPKVHLDLEKEFKGHFNILRGYVGSVHSAGVKVVGDYVDNWKKGYPSEFGLLLLYDPETGRPKAIMDATFLTWLRTGAVTGVGAKYLYGDRRRIRVGHLGVRGTARANLACLNTIYDIEEVVATSARRESREAFAEEMQEELGLTVHAVDSAEEAITGCDIVIEATRLSSPAPLIREEWLKPGCLFVTYGWVMAVEPGLPAAMDKIVVDDWEQCSVGGQLYPLIQEGKLAREDLHAEIGQVVAGHRPGREGEEERILFWHRGMAVIDVVVGSLYLNRAEELGRGIQWRFF